jgi:hypothetical protein
MRALLALSAAAGIGLICCQSAGAVPANVAAIKQAATTTTTVQQAQFWVQHHKHGITKCYRDFVIGAFYCHHFPL